MNNLTIGRCFTALWLLRAETLARQKVAFSGCGESHPPPPIATAYHWPLGRILLRHMLPRPQLDGLTGMRVRHVRYFVPRAAN